MQQRIFPLGGKVDVDSAPGHGTMVTAWVPTIGETHESPARVAG
jgi:signal transduction histidine kinase